MDENLILDSTIYRALHGSRAYGTHMPDSDYDEKGICVLSDPSYYFGFDRFEQKDRGWSDGKDRVIYDIRKFFRLALDCNPNIIEILFVEQEDLLHVDELGQEIRKNRNIFLSKKVAATFGGYAYSQLHRLKNHFELLTHPPGKPSEDNFVTTKYLSYEDRNPFKITTDKFDITLHPTTRENQRITILDKQAFKSANKKYQQYLDWQKSRNKERATLEAEYGYDLKHAYHLVRLLKMSIEILLEGKVLVKRPDAQDLLNIRKGCLSYQELLDLNEDLRNKLAYAEKNSVLPQQPDYQRAQKLLEGLVAARVAPALSDPTRGL